jgi:hypothetical protein
MALFGGDIEITTRVPEAQLRPKDQSGGPV